MSLIHNTAAQVHGEQTLARETLKVIPLIEKHFKPFDGQRAYIQSGESAAFKKVSKAFREEAATVTEAQVFTDNPGGMTVWIKIKLSEPDPKSSGCNYFDLSDRVGAIDSGDWNKAPTGLFSYGFDAAELTGICNTVLNTALEDIQKARQHIEELKRQTAAAVAAVPACYREAVR